MKYRLDKQEDCIVLTLEEQNLNSMVAPNLKTDFAMFSQEGTMNMILDISGVKYADSSGLSAILTGHRLWKESFVIVGTIQSSVQKLMDISRLNEILTFIPTVEEAKDYLKMVELERELMAE